MCQHSGRDYWKGGMKQRIGITFLLEFIGVNFKMYYKINQGKECAINMIHVRAAECHDVGIDGTTPIVHTRTTATDINKACTVTV